MILYEDLIKEFQKKKVKYVLVGGIAFNLLGGYRHTMDMDILVEMTDTNLGKVVKILKEAGYVVRQPVDPKDISNQKIREDWIVNKNMKAFNFYRGENTYEQVDIIIDSPVSYGEASKDVKWIRVNRFKLPVISIQNLVKMKAKTGRDVDQKDVEVLEWIQKEKTHLAGKPKKKKS